MNCIYYCQVDSTAFVSLCKSCKLGKQEVRLVLDKAINSQFKFEILMLTLARLTERLKCNNCVVRSMSFH